MKIWTHYAHQVFDKKISTVANDLRVYSINLLHHCVVYELFQDRNLILGLANNFKIYRSQQKGLERVLKQGMINCLENIATLCFIENKRAKGFDEANIPGLYKAETLLNNGDEIIFAIDRKEEILKNQTALGMSGRYIGPMMAIELFDKGLEYKDAQMDQLKNIFNSEERYRELKEKLKDLLLQLLKFSEDNKRPQISYHDLKRKYGTWNVLMNGYGACFGVRKVWKKLRTFFLSKIGLDKAAAGAIYDVIDEKKYTETIPATHFSLVLSDAKNKCEASTDKDRIEQILNVAPILSHTEYLIRRLADPDTDSIQELGNDIELVRNKINGYWPAISTNLTPELAGLKLTLQSSSSPEEWIRSLVSYHERLMNKRGGQPWVSIEEDGRVRHQLAPSLIEEYRDATKYLKDSYWYHPYYLNTLLGFKKSLN